MCFRESRASLPWAPSLRMRQRVRWMLRKALHRTQAIIDRRRSNVKKRPMPGIWRCLDVEWSFWLSSCRRRRAKTLRRCAPPKNSHLSSRPGSAPRHQEVADCPEVADSVDARTCPQKTTDIDGLCYSACRAPGPLERARAETGGADHLPW